MEHVDKNKIFILNLIGQCILSKSYLLVFVLAGVDLT